MIGTKIYPVTQKRTGKGKGQCTEAAIATLLGCALEDVPDIWAGPDVSDDAPPEVQQPQELRIRLFNWIKQEHRVMLCGVCLHPPATSFHAAWERALEIADSVSLPVRDVEWAEYHLLDGPNHEGVGHYVVGRRGVPVWDPNPLRRGIASVEGLTWLVPLHLVPDAARDLPAAVWEEQAPG